MVTIVSTMCGATSPGSRMRLERPNASGIRSAPSTEWTRCVGSGAGGAAPSISNGVGIVASTTNGPCPLSREADSPSLAPRHLPAWSILARVVVTRRALQSLQLHAAIVNPVLGVCFEGPG
jgi:hypothetical protein